MHHQNIDFFRSSIDKEKLVTLDFGYLTDEVENWWSNFEMRHSLRLAKFELASLILNKARVNDTIFFDQLGVNHISAVSVTNIFKTDCHKLARVVHETFSELFALNDIKYPYEEHKKLYLKPGGEKYKDWGNGLGEITPHSDDLYEDLNTDFLSLTVCRDNTNTATEFYFPKDILSNFTDSELTQLFKAKVKFTSGKNVTILKSRERSLIEFCPNNGYKFYLDFRIDNDTGERMLAVDKDNQILIDKMRKNISTCKRLTSESKTGTFSIVANYKVLHARAKMHIDQNLAVKIANLNDFSLAPRLLYRSKGQDSKFLNA